METVVLKRGREFTLVRRHPWIFAESVESCSGAPAAGEIVRIANRDGTVFGSGFYSPQSRIAVRVLSGGERGAV